MTISSPPPARLPAGTWVVDPDHPTVGFAVRHAGVSTVRGRFHAVEGRLDVRPGRPPTADELDAAWRRQAADGRPVCGA